jgi:imidazolonepropionase-like amidohydrolase/ABC-type multidrug transport system permease subunit
MKPYIAQIRSNLRLMGRDRSVLFFSYLFPLVFFFLFAQLFDAGQSPAAMAQVISMVLIIGVLGNGFFGAGMRAVQDRETNVLRRFKVAPVSAGPIIVAAIVSGLVSFVPTVLFFFLFARLVYHTPLPHNFLSVLIFVCIGLIAFRAIGMIIAAVVNSAQEAGILTQLMYLPMLFLSGATFPVSTMPIWVQTMAQFMPATYLYQGMQSIMIGGEDLLSNALPALALLVTLVVALVVGIKLFRWEKEEKISGRAKLWILAVLAPFILLGAQQAYTRQNIDRSKALARVTARSRTVLFQNVKIFTGNGRVINKGAVLIKDGKIAEVFDTTPTDTKQFAAEVIDSAGKTLMPGLIDAHVHLGAPGGIYKDTKDYTDQNETQRRLAAYLYSGVTAVRSTGDWLDTTLKHRKAVASGAYLGAEVFTCGPLFTAEGGHPTELLNGLPKAAQAIGYQQFVRLPKSPQEARSQVDDLKKAGVDCIKAVLQSGNPLWGDFNHLDPNIYRAVIEQAARDGLTTATHTGSPEDVKEAVDAGSGSIEHGSIAGLIPRETLAEMKTKGVAYDPTLSVYEESVLDLRSGNPAPLERPMVLQVGPARLIAATRDELRKQKGDVKKFEPLFQQLKQNLLRAYECGVPLIAGSDAGNMLVIHGPTVQHELELWVKAGIPPAAALQAATYNVAKVLHADNRIGSIQTGRDASFILLDGDPLQDISMTERISTVLFRGERISRSEVLKQDSK